MFLFRLILDFLALGLFFVAMAYWWMDNRTHEFIGTGMFGLLLLHNLFNRRWYGSLARTKPKARPLVTLGLNLTLLLSMLVLVVTSVLISQSLFRPLAIGGPTAREIHILAAYWALIIASIHLGLHWSIVMSATRNVLGIRGGWLLLTIILRISAAITAVFGVICSMQLDIGSRLLLIPTIQFWDFNEDAAGFFLRIGAIAGLYVGLGHYVTVALQSFSRYPQRRRRSVTVRSKARLLHPKTRKN